MTPAVGRATARDKPHPLAYQSYDGGREIERQRGPEQTSHHNTSTLFPSPLTPLDPPQRRGRGRQTGDVDDVIMRRGQAAV